LDTVQFALRRLLGPGPIAPPLIVLMSTLPVLLAQDHSYLGPLEDVQSPATVSLAMGDLLCVPLLMERSLVLPFERVALSLPDRHFLPFLLSSSPALFFVLAPGTSIGREHVGSFVQLTSRSEERRFGRTLCTCIGVCRAAFQSLGQQPSSGLLLATARVIDDPLLGDAVPAELRRGRGHVPKRCFSGLDAGRQAARVKDLLRASRHPPVALGLLEEASPSVLAWRALRALPLDDDTRKGLFCAPSICALLARLARVLEVSSRAPAIALTCGGCSTVVVRDTSSALANPFAARSSVRSEDHATSHVFVNPVGVSFRIFTCKKLADEGAEGAGACCSVEGPPVLEFSWFPNYAWQALLCASCDYHLGWKYSAASTAQVPQFFYGLRAEAVAYHAVTSEGALLGALASEGGGR
jgi:hypothetical protein